MMKQWDLPKSDIKETDKEVRKSSQRNEKLLIKVHRVLWVAMSHDLNNSKTTLSTAMSNNIFKQSQGLFCKHLWTSQHIHQFEILSNFLYDTVQEDSIDYPLRLTWINNVVHGEDDNLYATQLLFKMCTQCYLTIC